MDAIERGGAAAENHGMSEAERVLVGTLRRAYDFDGGHGTACVLVTDDGQAFHLTSLEGESYPAGSDPFEVLRRFEAQMVRVAFAERDDTVFGPALSGVQIEALGTA